MTLPSGALLKDRSLDPGIEAAFRTSSRSGALRVVSVLGTRPELIKFLPILHELRRRRRFESVHVFTSQHTDLVQPLLDLWNIRVDHDLEVMVGGQPLNALMSRILVRLDDVLVNEKPQLVLVQGDTTSALAGAVAASHRQIPVGHIEAGLRSGSRDNPFPEEVNRRLVTALTDLHFAPTRQNADTLLREGVPPASVFLTGNPIVDAIKMIRDRQEPSVPVRELLQRLAGHRIVVLTSHRRENVPLMRGRFRTIRSFVEAHPDIQLIFPVHPNPQVSEIARSELAGISRVHLLPPLDYPDFLHCLSAAWLIVSDSGGIQEEAPSLGKPLLILRSNTERPEVVDCGIARLVGDDPAELTAMLDEAVQPGSWVSRIGPVDNPFGGGDSARRIVNAIARWSSGASTAAMVRAQ